MDYTVHGILQARMLEWVAFPVSELRDWTQVSCIAGGFFISWATREAEEENRMSTKYILIYPLLQCLLSLERGIKMHTTDYSLLYAQTITAFIQWERKLNNAYCICLTTIVTLTLTELSPRTTSIAVPLSQAVSLQVFSEFLDQKCSRYRQGLGKRCYLFCLYGSG